MSPAERRVNEGSRPVAPHLPSHAPRLSTLGTRQIRLEDAGMIHIVMTAREFYSLPEYAEAWGPGITRRVQYMSYRRLCTRRRLPLGTYIFSDLDRLSAGEAERAARAWASLAAEGQVRLLNHPTRSLRRYELLRTLFESGANSFNVYRLTEQRMPARFPVFIREDAHGSVRGGTELLYTPDELRRAIARIDRDGLSRESRLIVEFCDTSNRRGIFPQYTAYVIGDEVIPTALYHGRDWRSHTWDLRALLSAKELRDELLTDERRYIDANPHSEALRRAAALARIEYGRVDYGVAGGRVEVWEINTNPSLPDRRSPRDAARVPIYERFAMRLERALDAVAPSAYGGAPDGEPTVINGAAEPTTRRVATMLIQWAPRKYKRRVVRGLRWIRQRVPYNLPP
jgi:hypothetical protein